MDRHELTLDACIKEYENAVTGHKPIADMNFDSAYKAPPKAITRSIDDVIIFENLSDKEKVDLLFELASSQSQVSIPIRSFL
jgi:hypothetical protein